MKAILLFTLCLVSCCTNVAKDKTSTSEYKIIEIDGCEYIKYDGGENSANRVYVLVHKGNCKNIIHNCK